MCWVFAPGDLQGSSKPARGPSESVCGRVGVEGDHSWRRRSMAERCTPVSTARMDSLVHPTDNDRTKNAVQLSSNGPPPAP